MIRTVLLLCVLGLAAASPALVRSREEVEAFRNFLESTKTNDGNNFLARTKLSPLSNPEENSGKYQGDIVLDDFMIEDMVQGYAVGRNAYIFPDTHWPNNTVVWQFGEGEFDPVQQQAIKDGIQDIENHTCIKFRYREPEDTVFVNVTGGPGGCYAHVGYWEPREVHVMNLAANLPGVGCFRHATIVHEWMHILGFLHMHSTYNRDDYVDIIEENVAPGRFHNFDIYTSELVSNNGIEYDYVSCLHYGPFAFTVNGEPTIVPKKEIEGTMGQRVFITEKDWLRINRHYNCSGAWDEVKEEIKEYSKQEEDDVDDEEQEFEIVGDSEDVDEEYGENGEVLDVDEEDEELIKRLIAVQLLQMKK
ncbi:seminal metalloprotease 1-like [Danaus plexippus]|uniref:seminal metalloprotease 1-like n=1 Tax=Danaus plexippus TaxID=13037 RepID=UPI002AB1A8ED|nr:seminal metalloprotease 1-like [Danaus plexippus]